MHYGLRAVIFKGVFVTVKAVSKLTLKWIKISGRRLEEGESSKMMDKVQNFHLKYLDVEKMRGKAPKSLMT